MGGLFNYLPYKLNKFNMCYNFNYNNRYKYIRLDKLPNSIEYIYINIGNSAIINKGIEQIISQNICRYRITTVKYDIDIESINYRKI